jgi:hypothetical protein
MIFYDQKTRKEFSNEVEKELKDFVIDCMKYAIRHKDLIMGNKRDYNFILSDVYDDKRFNEFPHMVSMMIQKSGIVFPCDTDDNKKEFFSRHYPVTLYYDNAEDFEDEFVNAFTFFRNAGMRGGIINGCIHT